MEDGTRLDAPEAKPGIYYMYIVCACACACVCVCVCVCVCARARARVVWLSPESKSFESDLSLFFLYANSDPVLYPAEQLAEDVKVPFAPAGLPPACAPTPICCPPPWPACACETLPASIHTENTNTGEAGSSRVQEDWAPNL